VAIAGFNTFRGVQIGSMSAAILIAVVPVSSRASSFSAGWCRASAAAR